MKYLGLFLYELIDLAPPPSKVALKTQAIVAHCQQSYKCSGDQVIVLAREGAQQKSEQTVEFHESQECGLFTTAFPVFHMIRLSEYWWKE